MHIINSIIINLKFQHKPKYIIFHIKTDLLLLLLPKGQNPLSYYIAYNESKHNILALVGKANKVVKGGTTRALHSTRALGEGTISV
jgi:hypothetical protein